MSKESRKKKEKAAISLETKTKAKAKLRAPKRVSNSVRFTKMSGAGNDFVVIDNRRARWQLSPAQIARICHRQEGVGADGLLLAQEGTAGADYTMVYHNADGSLADMCGNGARCFARFVQPLKKSTRERVTFQTGAGLIQAGFQGTDVVINMTPPHSLQRSLTVPTTTGDWIVHSINTGVPHLVCFVNDVTTIDVRSLGAELRYHPLYSPLGTNVNFVQTTGPDSIMVRTYERGVEGETLACGTGVVASAILACVIEGVGKPLKVAVRSGVEMTVDFEHNDDAFTHVTLQGPATITFTGRLALPVPS